MTLEETALNFVEHVHMIAFEAKPNANELEVQGLALNVLMNAFNTYEQIKQIQRVSTQESSEGARAGSNEVPEVGASRGAQESPERIRKESRGTTRGGRKKRRIPKDNKAY